MCLTDQSHESCQLAFYFFPELKLDSIISEHHDCELQAETPPPPHANGHVTSLSHAPSQEEVKLDLVRVAEVEAGSSVEPEELFMPEPEGVVTPESTSSEVITDPEPSMSNSYFQVYFTSS